MLHTLLEIVLSFIEALNPSGDISENALLSLAPNFTFPFLIDNSNDKLSQDDLCYTFMPALDCCTDSPPITADICVTRAKQFSIFSVQTSSYSINQRIISAGHEIPLWLFELF